MMKRISLLLLCLLLILSSAVAVSATSASMRIVDNEDLLTSDEEFEIAQRLDDISDTFQCDVVIVTEAYLEGKTATEYADDFYDYNGYGYGSTHDGILLLVSLQEREWAMSTCGEAIDMFTDSALAYMEDQFRPMLSDGDYYGAFITFADLCDEVIEGYRNGDSYYNDYYGDSDYYGDNNSGTYFNILWIPLSAAIGIVIAFIVTGVMKSKLKSVRFQSAANSYVRQGSFNLSERRDLFLYSKVTRRPKPKDTSSHGGSSTHVSSSGRSHGGSSGSF